MKAVLFGEHGGTEKLSYEDLPVPVIGPEEVLVRVKACALNHLDIWMRQGNPAYPIPLPHVSGSDMAGLVEDVGEYVEGVTVGQRVLVSPGLSCWKCEACLAGRDNFCRSFGIIGAMTHGGYAEYVKVPFRNVLAIPENLSFEAAAAFPLVSVTASHMLFALAGLQYGETVLIMGAGSGVGMMAVQLAKLAGARVLATVGSDDKIPKAVVLGADAVINHSREHVVERVKLLTEGRGVDVKIILRYLFSRQLTIKGSYMGTRAELIKATELIGQKRLISVIDRTYPLRDARAAQEQMLSRRFFGKIVLTV